MDMHPAGTLANEHVLILELVDALAGYASHAEAVDRLDHGIASEFVSLIRNFADAAHHAKEETLLFPALEAAGLRGPTMVMRHEHEIGRGFTGAMADALHAGPSGARMFAEGAQHYVALLREHIEKENQVLFPMSREVLTEAEAAELTLKFAETDRVVSPEGLDGWQQRVEALRARVSELAGAAHDGHR